MRAVVPAIVALACLGCGEPAPFVIDTFPVAVDLSAGLLAIDAEIPSIGDRHVALDTSSPITFLGATDLDRRVVTINLKNGAATRARFDLVSAVLAPLGPLGTGTPLEVGGIIGGDVLSQIAISIDPTAQTALLFPTLAGGNEAHEDACDAVFPVALQGAGRYVIGDEEVQFGGTRIAIPACTGSTGTFAGPSGHDLLFLLATGFGPTVVARSSWRRITGMTDAQIDALPQTTLFLGDTAGVTVASASLPDLALVARERAERGPCLELYLARTLGGLLSCPQPVHDAFPFACDCTGDEPDCSAGARAELDREVPVVILDDAHPLLQGLRNDFRPALAEIDGLLGMDALASFLLDVDYPGSRTIFRCSSADCIHRPHIAGGNRDRARELTQKGCFP